MGVVIYILITGKKLFPTLRSNMFCYSQKLKNFKGFKEKKEIVQQLDNDLFDLLKKIVVFEEFSRLAKCFNTRENNINPKSSKERNYLIFENMKRLPSLHSDAVGEKKQTRATGRAPLRGLRAPRCARPSLSL